MPFDGRMVDLRFNHLAIVSNGRNGPDVTVADRLPRLAGRGKVSPELCGCMSFASLGRLVCRPAYDASAPSRRVARKQVTRWCRCRLCPSGGGGDRASRCRFSFLAGSGRRLRERAEGPIGGAEITPPNLLVMIERKNVYARRRLS